MLTVLLLLSCDPYVVKMGGEGPLDADGDGVSVDAGDCDDTDPSVAPGVAETCDGVDSDCDGAVDEDVGGTWYADADGDGFGDPDDALVACTSEGRVDVAGDCDDADPAVRPGAGDVCDGRDEDCDGEIDEDGQVLWYADADGDGFGDEATVESACGTERPGWSRVPGDCDDATARAYPGRPEDCDG
jgi:hypothetical protein